MVAITEPDTAPDTIEATVNYHPGQQGLPSTEASGGRAQDCRRVLLRNGRLNPAGFALDSNGFRFVRHDSEVVNFFDGDEVRRVFYSELEALVGAEGRG